MTSHAITQVRVTPMAFRDMPMLEALVKAGPALTGSESLGKQAWLAPGTHVSKTVPTEPGLGVQIDPEALDRLHENDLNTTIRNRDDLAQMRKVDPSFTGHQPRF